MKTLLKVLGVALFVALLIGVLMTDADEVVGPQNMEVVSSEPYDPYAYVCGGVTDSSSFLEQRTCYYAKANGITEKVALEREESRKRDQYNQRLAAAERICKRKAALEGISYRKCYRYLKSNAKENFLN